MSDTFRQFERYSRLLSKWFNWVAGVAAVGMLGLVMTGILIAFPELATFLPELVRY